ncbi:MAG: S8 family serine peptidase [Phycisphaerales bacterium]|nr:MAG: S8 family serine peptidase [Phycisphaerales bacterium]
MRRVATVLLGFVGILLAGSHYGWASQQEKPKVIRLSEQSPGPIAFPKIDRRPRPGHPWGSSKMESLPKFDPNSPNPSDVDLRGDDLSKLDLRNNMDALLYTRFDDDTVWPKLGLMPKGFDPKTIMELGKNPGLGVRTLHESGITGKGVGVGIIDQPLLTEHQEYADRLRLYEENNVRDGDRSEMHGPAVASIAVGRTIGVAPDADLYYIATRNTDVSRSGTPDNFAFKAQSIRRLLEVNRQLPADRKIRVISMSIGWNARQDGYDEIMAACEEAEAAGVFVINCGSVVLHGFTFYGVGRHPLANPDVFESYEPCAGWLPSRFCSRWYGFLLVPMDSRTMACRRGSDKYHFGRTGGFSWVPPYLAGVYALAAQVEPEITPWRFWALAMKTGRLIEVQRQGERYSMGPIIDPVRLIRSIRAGELASFDRKQRRSREELLTLVRQAVGERRIWFKRTTPEEFRKIAGTPTTEITCEEGKVLYVYPGVAAMFLRDPRSGNPYIIEYVVCEGRKIDIGQN